VRGIKIKSQGFQTWSEDHIAQFEVKHGIGTKARLALALLLYTGQRRGDVVRMGKQHVRNGILTIKQQKTGIEVAIPVHHKLHECLSVAQREHLTFLVTDYGQPFTPAGFTNKFREWCREAGLPKGLSPHGLRNAMCRRVAEAGCTPQSWQSAVTKVSRKSRGTPRRQAALA
jgi:integrase